MSRVDPHENSGIAIDNNTNDNNIFTNKRNKIIINNNSSISSPSFERVPPLLRELVKEILKNYQSKKLSTSSTSSSRSTLTSASTPTTTTTMVMAVPVFELSSFFLDRIDSLHSYCLRILSSRILPPSFSFSSTSSLDYLIDTIKRTSINNEDFDQLEELLHKFKNFNGIKEKWNLLYLLTAMRDSNPHQQYKYYNKEQQQQQQQQQQQFPSSSPHQFQPINSYAAPPINWSFTSTLITANLPQVQEKKKIPEDRIINHINHEENNKLFSNHSPPPPPPPPSSSSSSTLPLSRIIFNNLPDNDLIRSLLYSFEGINSEHLYFDSNFGTYRLFPQSAALITKPKQNLIIRIAQMGGLYRRICLWLNRGMEKISNAYETTTTTSIVGRQSTKENYNNNINTSNNIHNNTNTSTNNTNAHGVSNSFGSLPFYSSSLSDGIGLIEQSLIGSIQEELKEYYRLIAILETQFNQSISQTIINKLKQTTLSPSTLHPTENPPASNTAKESITLISNGSASTFPSSSFVVEKFNAPDTLSSTSPVMNTVPAFSFRRLYISTQESFHRLLLVSSLLATSNQLKGGALLSHLYSHLSHGIPSLSSLNSRLLENSCRPFLLFLNRWIDSGELNDIHNEFFIRINENIPVHRWWMDKYELRSSMVPSFIPIELAGQILAIGKTVNFIRYQCNHTAFTANVKLNTQILIPNSHPNSRTSNNSGKDTTDTNHIINFPIVVNEISYLVNSHLLSLLHKRYDLLGTARRLKSYLLLSRGDFISHLLNVLHSELNKNARELNIRRLKVLLDAAVRNCVPIGNEEEKESHRLIVKLIKVGGRGNDNLTGWDVFSLDYMLDSPLNLIYTPTCMTIYLRLFNFLWRLKRVEYELVECWKRQMKSWLSIKNTFNKSKKSAVVTLEKILRLSQLLRCEMHHLSINLHSYLTFEVLDIAWSDFCRILQSARSLDEILSAHTLYLHTILEKSMLAGSAVPLSHSLGIIFDDILAYVELQERIYQESNAFCLKRGNLEKHSKTSSQSSHPIDEELEATSPFFSSLFYYSKQMDQISDAFHSHLCEFFDELDLAVEKGQRGGGMTNSSLLSSASTIGASTSSSNGRARGMDISFTADDTLLHNTHPDQTISSDLSYSPAAHTHRSLNFQAFSHSHTHTLSPSLSPPSFLPINYSFSDSSSPVILIDLGLLRARLDVNCFYFEMREKRKSDRNNYNNRNNNNNNDTNNNTNIDNINNNNITSIRKGARIGEGLVRKSRSVMNGYEQATSIEKLPSKTLSNPAGTTGGTATYNANSTINLPDANNSKINLKKKSIFIGYSNKPPLSVPGSHFNKNNNNDNNNNSYNNNYDNDDITNSNN